MVGNYKFLQTNYNDNEVVNSFGRVKRIHSDSQLEVTYKEMSLIINTNKKYKVGEWVRFYGTMKHNICDTIFTMSMNGYDILLLEKAINYFIKHK